MASGGDNPFTIGGGSGDQSDQHGSGAPGSTRVPGAAGGGAPGVDATGSQQNRMQVDTEVTALGSILDCVKLLIFTGRSLSSTFLESGVLQLAV